MGRRQIPIDWAIEISHRIKNGLDKKLL